MQEDAKRLELTTDIVAAYVGNNTLATSDLPALIRTVYSALSGAESPAAEAEPATAKATSAQIRKSITPEALISFEDGKPYKTLKRHLARLGLSLDGYKAKWGLPRDYPTTAPSYSARRSEMAKSLGLGRKIASKGGAKRKAPAPKA